METMKPALFVAISCAVLSLSAASPGQPDFSRTEAFIPMRDGIKLYTEIYVPRDSPERLPFLITRTPYGVTPGRAPGRELKNAYKELAQDGYIFVFQDIRGRYQSEGRFVMLRRPRERSDPKAIDESTDAFDTIEWLLKNVANHNGRAGMLGISYGGWLTVMAAIDPHPALKAVSEQASPADMYLGDDFHHNGAFRLSYGFEYAALMETSKTNFSFAFDRYDTYEWYLKLGPLSNADKKYSLGKLPTWAAFVAHPNYDEFWRGQAVPPYLGKPAVPNLNVAGWWDQEDFYGPLKIYETLEKNDPDHRNYLAAGPWNHGGWARGDGRKLGRIDFGSDTARYFREKIQAPWFAFWLKDQGSLPLHEALTFETGSNKWELHDEWPPRRNVTRRKLYFREAGSLSFDSPRREGKQEFDSYVSDPVRPVPYRQRPIEPTYPGPGWPVWLLEDQRFVHLRPDVLSWETEALNEDVVVAGDIVARLYASTSGSDSDWIVKLIDVYPEKVPADPKMGGYQLMIASEVLRGRFRRGFEKPEPVASNRVNEYTIDLHSNHHAFLKGHRIMAQVQSTWFPLIDRNPQKYVSNIFKATEADFRKATQRVYRSRALPSHIELPVAGR